METTCIFRHVSKRPDTVIHSWSLQILLVLQLRKFACLETFIFATGVLPLQETVFCLYALLFTKYTQNTLLYKSWT